MNLLDFRYDKYSSTGNDGIIEKVFQVLGLEKGFFVEFGAWDGIKGSNCRQLFEKEWDGIFIEAHPVRYAQLKENYKDFDNIICINSMVSHETNAFDRLVADHVVKGIDFCSIDIDGLDLEVFETFEKFMPTVICIEGGQMLEPNHERLPIQIAAQNIQQSLKVMRDSFESKGYDLLCSYQDSFFIKKELSHLFDVSGNILEMYLDGLHAHHRRLPWIQYILRQSDLRNKIINYILQKSEYNDYGYANRKLWAIEKKDITLKNIEMLQNKARKGK